jgi:hypothetical protein
MREEGFAKRCSLRFGEVESDDVLIGSSFAQHLSRTAAAPPSASASTDRHQCATPQACSSRCTSRRHPRDGGRLWGWAAVEVVDLRLVLGRRPCGSGAPR